MMKTDAGSRDLAIKTVFAVLALGATTLPAAAAEADVPQRAVHFSDLDVSHELGATVLYRRIASAASMVCSNLDRADLASKMQFKACVNKAIQDAVTAVNQPMLLAVYQAKHGTSRPLSVASLDARQVRSP